MVRRFLNGLVFGLTLVACDEPKPADSAKSAASDVKLAAQKLEAEIAARQVKERAAAKAEAEANKAPSAVDCPGAPELKFFDPALEAEIRKKLTKEEGEITRAELKKVRSVNLARAKVDYLDPCIFPHLTNLRQLYLGPGKLNDLSPISSLIKLDSIRASLNRISDLSPLSGMTKMDRLDLARTQVEDLTPLSGMSELTELQLDNTPVSDLSPLSSLKKLERLSLKNTKIKDVGALLPLTKLKFLYVEGTPLENTFVLAPLRKKGLKVSED